MVITHNKQISIAEKTIDFAQIYDILSSERSCGTTAGGALSAFGQMRNGKGARSEVFLAVGSPVQASELQPFY